MFIKQVHYVVIGASAAGVAAVVKLRQLDANALITCISRETDFPYNKCFLADYLAGVKEPEQVFLRKKDFFESQNIQLLLGTEVVKIEPESKQVLASDGTYLEYDKLLLAVGSSVHRPSIEGLQGEGVFEFNTFSDAAGIIEYQERNNVENIIIIGAGLSGLECADSLSRKGCNVSVVECADSVLHHQITLQASLFIQNKMQQQGVTLLAGVTVTKIERDSGTITGVLLSDGTLLPTQMVICALGARPNTGIALQAGLAIEQLAIVTNDFLQTTDPFIFAAGDVALVTDTVTGKKMRSCSWPDALVQGAAAASNMAGVKKMYAGTTTITTTAFFGVKFALGGQIKVHENDGFEIALHQEADLFQLVVTSNSVVKGFLVIGNTHSVSKLKQALLTKSVLSL